MEPTNLALTAEVLSVEHATETEPSLCLTRKGDEYIAINPSTEMTATHVEPQKAFNRLVAKLHDRATPPLSTREDMERISVDELDGVIHEHETTTRTAIDEGFIEVHRERVSCETIPVSDWVEVSDDIDTISGGETHTRVAGCVEAILRGHGFNVLVYESDAHYGAKPGGMQADIAVPHAGIYVEITGHEHGSLSDTRDKIARCLDLGKKPKVGEPMSPRIVPSRHIYNQPPDNPVRELIYVPWFDEAERLDDTTDVTLPLYTFSRSDKELQTRRR